MYKSVTDLLGWFKGFSSRMHSQKNWLIWRNSRMICWLTRYPGPPSSSESTQTMFRFHISPSLFRLQDQLIAELERMQLELDQLRSRPGGAYSRLVQFGATYLPRNSPSNLCNKCPAKCCGVSGENSNMFWTNRRPEFQPIRSYVEMNFWSRCQGVTMMSPSSLSVWLDSWRCCWKYTFVSHVRANGSIVLMRTVNFIPKSQKPLSAPKSLLFVRTGLRCVHEIFWLTYRCCHVFKVAPQQFSTCILLLWCWLI